MTGPLPRTPPGREPTLQQSVRWMRDWVSMKHLFPHEVAPLVPILRSYHDMERRIQDLTEENYRLLRLLQDAAGAARRAAQPLEQMDGAIHNLTKTIDQMGGPKP